ncbi:MAG: DMT family transporter [Rhodobiaceae bacterium]|nr:DMT family transporter [Rhodobiaceae bacterium]
MSLYDWFRILLLSLVWGGSFFFVEVALPEAGPLTIVFYRVTIAAAALWVWCAMTGEKVPRGPGIWFAFLAMGILNNVIPFSLIAFGQTEISSALASILNATTPLFAVVVAHVWPDGERATANKVAGVIIGIAGTAVLIGPSLLDAGGTLVGKLAVLAASFSYAIAMNFGKRLLKSGSPVVSAAGMLTASSVVMLPLAMVAGNPFSAFSPATWGAMVGLALLCSAFAYLLYFGILSTAGPTNLSLVTFLIPISASALGIAFLGETIALYQIAGLVLILIGLACVDGRVLKAFGRKAEPAAGSD